MSQPGDRDFRKSAAAPAADSSAPTSSHLPTEHQLHTDAYPTSDPSPGVRAWDAAPTCPPSAPAYPVANPYPAQPYPAQLPQYQQPHPGAPYAGFPYPVREAPMCGLAVASLVCGIVWIYWITSILAIIFAAVALGKIKREGLRGRGLAIAGLVLGIIWLALLVLGLIGFVVGGTSGLLPFAGT